MSNLILTSIGKVVMLSVLAIIFAFGVFVLCGIIYVIFISPITIKKKHKNACKNQHLMFNQLKKGDFVWEVYGDNLTSYKVESISYGFGNTNECRRMVIHTKSIKNEYDTRNISIDDIKLSKSFKFGNYYTLFGEANSIATMTKNKRKEAIASVSVVSNDEITKEVNKVIERLNDFKKKL